MAATGSPQVSDRSFRFGPFELLEREGELRKNGVRVKTPCAGLPTGDTSRPYRGMPQSFPCTTWAQVDKGNHLGWQAFSHDGRFLYYMQPGLIPTICRLRVSDHHIDRFPLKNFTGTGHWGVALSLSPDDKPLLLRDTSDLYALELEWK